MVKIRLRRIGAKKQPSYRVVVADSRAPRDGRFIETIGHYNPRTEPPTVVIFEDRALYWLSVGAQPSEPVARFFDKLGLPAKLAQVHGGAAIEAVAAPRPKPRAAAEPAVAKRPGPARAPVTEAAEAGEAAQAAAAAEAPEAIEPEEPPPAAEVPAAQEQVAEAARSVSEAAAPPQEMPAAAPASAKAPAKARAGRAAKAPALADLGLSPRVLKALEADGIETTPQLVAKLGEGQDALLSLSGIGAKAVEEIVEKLGEHGVGVS
jgi:small subunit ribosomal protein S16